MISIIPTLKKIIQISRFNKPGLRKNDLFEDLPFSFLAMCRYVIFLNFKILYNYYSLSKLDLVAFIL